jgi:hypothetical protein
MQNNKKYLQNSHAVQPEFVIMYYERQYARMEHLESQRLTLSNVVITITVLGFTFGFGDTTKLNLLTGIGLPLIIAVANVFAIIYERGSSAICRVHQKRAHATLERYASSLYSINNEIELPNLKLAGRLTSTLTCLHILLVAASLLPITAYVVFFIRK